MQTAVPSTWFDDAGREWRTPRRSSCHRLDFRIRAHAALRAYVFRRDDFICRHCGRRPDHVPPDYDGRTYLRASDGVVMVVDHIVTAFAGESAGHNHHPSNLQTLCDVCNARKGKSVHTPG